MVYLVFNAGWGGGGVDLASEAIQLGRALSELMPDEGEVLALLALMLLHNARRDAPYRDGEIVLLDDQDRRCGTTSNRRRPRAGQAGDHAR